MCIIVAASAVALTLWLSGQSGKPHNQRAENLFERPASVVNFVGNPRPSPGGVIRTANAVCINVVPQWLNENQSDSDTLLDHTFSHYELQIDDRVMSPKQLQTMIFAMGSAIYRDGQPPQDVGMAGFVEICSYAELPEGLHSATITAESTSGQVFSYSRAFKVDKNIADAMSTNIAATKDPFAHREMTRCPVCFVTPTSSK